MLNKLIVPFANSDFAIAFAVAVQQFPRVRKLGEPCSLANNSHGERCQREHDQRRQHDPVQHLDGFSDQVIASSGWTCRQPDRLGLPRFYLTASVTCHGGQTMPLVHRFPSRTPDSAALAGR